MNTAEGTTVVLSEHVWHCAVSMSLVATVSTTALHHCGAPRVAPCPPQIVVKQLKREEKYPTQSRERHSLGSHSEGSTPEPTVETLECARFTQGKIRRSKGR